MRETFPEKFGGQTLSASLINQLGKVARRQSSGVTSAFSHGSEGVTVGLAPHHQRILAVTQGSSSLRPPTYGELNAEVDNRLLARPRYYDKGTRSWKTAQGNSFFIDADQFGTRLEVGDEFTGVWDAQRGSYSAIPNYLPVGIVPVLNKRGIDIPQHDVIGLNVPITLPRTDPDGDELDTVSTGRFENQLGFEGIEPTEADHTGQFGICLRAIKADEIGWCCVSGIAAIRLNLTEPEYRYADVEDNCSQSLKAVECGSAQILWKDDDGYGEYGCGLNPEYGEDGESYYNNWRWAIIRMSNDPCTPIAAMSSEMI